VKEIRVHGRGGQGAVIAAQMLAAAFVKEGKYATSFPMFGGERRGAPVSAFVRFDDKPIRLRTQIYYPDCLIIIDPMLSRSSTVFTGLKPGGIVIVNFPRPLSESPHENVEVMGIVDATGIALAEIGRAITNTCILGALARTTAWLMLDSILESFKGYFSGKVLDGNMRCATRGFRETEIMRFGGK